MPHAKKTAGVILAAGMSTRFGQPKQLLKLEHKYLLEWVLDAALASLLHRVVLVVGYAHQKILRELGTKASHPRLKAVVNHRYREGQSRSLQAGLAAIRRQHSSVMFLLGDQPLLKAATINLMLDRFWTSEEKDICVPVCRQKRGNPTIFSRAMYGHLMQLEGDVGARDLIRANPAGVLAVEVEEPSEMLDIDSPQDLDKVHGLLLKSVIGRTDFP